MKRIDFNRKWFFSEDAGSWFSGTNAKEVTLPHATGCRYGYECDDTSQVLSYAAEPSPLDDTRSSVTHR